MRLTERTNSVSMAGSACHAIHGAYACTELAVGNGNLQESHWIFCFHLTLDPNLRVKYNSYITVLNINQVVALIQFELLATG